MQRLSHTIIIGAALLCASVGAAEYRFEVSGGGLGWGWGITVFDSTNVVPAEPAAPVGYEITYPAPAGSDSVTWRNRRSGLAGRTCLSCQSVGNTPWLGRALAAAPFIPTGAQVVDTQQVTVGGVSRTYITASYLVQGSVDTRTAFLVGVGMVFYSESQNTFSAMSNWNSTLRLLEYNGINIDTLWGNALPQPVAIAPSTRREAVPRFAPRRIDLSEMGIFLGRKSSLDRSKPLPAGVK